MDTAIFISGPRGRGRSELPIIGVVADIKVVVDDPEENVEQMLTLTKLYIDAARSLQPDFKASVFNASYGLNNLPYLDREWDETGSLYRVFVPFSADEEASPDIIESHDIAGMRGLLQAGEDVAEEMTDEVRNLLLYYDTIR